METKRRHELARHGWLPSSQPAWLNDEAYTNKIQPKLAKIAVPATATLDISSTPLNADIEVDGSFIGNTPSSFGLGSGRDTHLIIDALTNAFPKK